MDLRRVERLLALARRMGATRLSVTDNGVEMELGPRPAEQPTATVPARRRADPRDTKSVDEYLRQRLNGGSSESS